MEGWKPEPGTLCQLCGVRPVGPGGIICPDCRVAIETANAELTARLAAEG